MQGSANLNLMIRAVRTGSHLLRDFREIGNLQASKKGTENFAERAAVKADRAIQAVLMGTRTNYGWLGHAAERAGKDPTRRWIVDPLNGILNFRHGLPHWAISVALEHKGEIIAAVVYDACGEEIFATEKGSGAFVNESRLRVSARSRVAEAVFAAGSPGAEQLPAVLGDIAKIAPVCAGVRYCGAPALELVFVAAGRYEGYWGRGLGARDIAAGILLVRHSGGLVESMRPGGRNALAGDILAANEPIFDKFAKIIRENRQGQGS